MFFLIGEAGWRALAKRYRASVLFAGTWTLCPTGQMALVSVDHRHLVDAVAARLCKSGSAVRTVLSALALTACPSPRAA